jgi:hypothetical protein
MTTVVDVFLKEIRDRRQELSDHLGNGTAKDYPEYRDLCGQIRGLTIAETYLTDLLKKQEYTDDE